jgi:hypothetical protein
MSGDPPAAAPAALSLELAEPVPPEVPVGADVVLQVRVSGAACDLRGFRVEVVAGEEVAATAELIAFRDNVNETAAFTVAAPVRVGAFNWTIRFPPQEIGGIAYGEAVLPVSSQTRPHRTSLAVWAVHSPVQIANRFAITVGAKSSGACALSGARIEISNDAGAVVGEGILGDTPWPGSDALYWTEIILPGPAKEGLQCWTAAFTAVDLELPHLGSSAQFSFTAVKPPEHRVAVTVTESGVAAPVEQTEIALGPHRAATDKTGMAHIEVPGGTYHLAVWKSGLKAASRTVEIAADVSVRFELVRLPSELTAWD